MPSPEELFVLRLNEIAAAYKRRDRADMLLIAAAIRHLLLDEKALLHQVNRKLRHKVRFKVNNPLPHGEGPPPVVQLTGHGMDPHEFPPMAGVRELRLKEFLEEPVIRTTWGNATVREIVDFAANKMGGVHHDSRRTAEEQALEDILTQIRPFMFGRDPVSIILEGIASVVLRSLKPVRDGIWKPGSDLKLFSYYRSAIGEFTTAPGTDKYFNAPVTHELGDGFTFCGLFMLPPRTYAYPAVVYQLGSPKAPAPRLTLAITPEQTLVGVFSFGPSAAERLTVTASEQILERMRHQPAFVSLELSLGASETALELYFAGRLIERAVTTAPVPRAPITHQTMGGAVSGGFTALVRWRELVMIQHPLTKVQRRQLAAFFQVLVGRL